MENNDKTNFTEGKKNTVDIPKVRRHGSRPRGETILNNKKALIAAAVVVVVLLIAYLANASSYKTHFIKGTKINGVNVSKMTVQEAADALKATEENYELDLTFREDKTEKITSKEVGFHYEANDDIQKLLDAQNRFAWGLGSIGLAKSDDHVDSTYEKDVLRKKLNQIPELQKKNMEAPVDAHIEYKKGKFEVVKESEGTTLKTKKAKKIIKDAIVNGETSVDFTKLEDVYKAPKIYEDDKTLNEQIDTLEKYCSAEITYDLPGKDEQTLDGKTLMTWLKKSDDGVYTKDEELWNENLSNYVNALWEKVGTLFKPHKFKTIDGNVVTVPGVGYYGYKLDIEGEKAQLAKELEKGKKKTREPLYLQKEAAEPDDNYGYGDTYVEVNLTKQVLYVFQKGKMVFSTSVVSGKDVAGRRTPAGAYYAYDKQREKDLVGADYVSHVHYWIRLTGNGVGIHDATWRGRFGGNIWRTAGSHGCINVPIGAAATIYNLVEEDTPVAVFYE